MSEDVQPQVAECCGPRVDPRVHRTRERVLAATRDLLADGGIEAASVNAVAKRAGVNKTTIYRNWPDPHDLVKEAVAGLGHAPAPPDTGSLRGDLIELFGGLAAAMQRPPWDRLLPSVIGAAARDERIREEHGALTRARRAAAGAIVQRAVERDELAHEIDPTDVIELVVGPLYYRLLMTKEHVSADDITALVDRALRALEPDRGRARPTKDSDTV